MAVPKQKTSKARKRKRRAHHAIQNTAAIVECPQCGASKLYHHACGECGDYGGRTNVLE